MTGHIDSNDSNINDSNINRGDDSNINGGDDSNDVRPAAYTARNMPVLVAELQAVIGAHLDTVRACAVAWERSDQFNERADGVDEQDRSAALDEAALRGKHEMASGMLLWSVFGDLERLAAAVAASGAAPGVRVERSPSPLAGDLPWQQDLASAVATIEGRPEDAHGPVEPVESGVSGERGADVPVRQERVEERPEWERLDERPDFLFLRMPVDDREEFAQWWLGVQDDLRCFRAFLRLNARPDVLRQRFAAQIAPRVRRWRLGVWAAAVGIIAATWGLGMVFDLLTALMTGGGR